MKIRITSIYFSPLTSLRYTRRSITIFLFFSFLQSCVYGALGNSTTEKAEELQALYRIGDQRRTNLSPFIYYSDDQADGNLADFTVSGSPSYHAVLTSNTVVLESISFLFSPPDSILPFSVSSLSASEYHALHSGGSSGSTGDGSYAIKYGIQGSFSPGDIGVSNFTSLSGPVHSQNLNSFPPVPYGTLAHIFGEYSEIFLDFTITRQSDSAVRTLHLELREAEIEIEPSCNLNIPYTKTIPFSIGFRVDGLLSARAGSSFSLLDSIFALPSSEITVSDSQNSGLYSEVLLNLEEPGQVLVFYSCL